MGVYKRPYLKVLIDEILPAGRLPAMTCFAISCLWFGSYVCIGDTIKSWMEGSRSTNSV
jgi:hypothetical protein